MTIVSSAQIARLSKLAVQADVTVWVVDAEKAADLKAAAAAARVTQGMLVEVHHGKNRCSTMMSRPRPAALFGDSVLNGPDNEFGKPEVVGHPDARVLCLLLERTCMEPGESPLELRPGAKIELIPSHGCTTCNLIDRVDATRRDVAVAVWTAAARGRSQSA